MLLIRDIGLAGFLSLQAGDGVGYVQQFIKALETDPRDHELPGLLAQFLYRLDLLEEGDDFRSRVMTIAPTSGLAYRTELLRADTAGDAEAADASARRAIENDIEDRRFAYQGAVQYLLRAAIRNGTVAEETAWLEATAPGIFDVDSDSVPQKHRVSQGIAFDAWYATLPRDEVLRRLDILLEKGKAMGFEYTDDPYTHLTVLAVRGQIQEAIQVALDEVFTRSVAMNLGWRETFAQAQFAHVVADERVQAAMQRWEEEEDALRAQVRSYLADLQAAS